MHKLASKLVAACLLAASSAFSAEPYTLIDLGPNVWPKAVNESGTIVVGFSEGDAEYPVVWSGGVLTRIDSPGWFEDVNSSGTVVGVRVRQDPTGTTPSPIVYQHGTVSPLPAEVGAALAINDSGTIGGWAMPGGPFLYRNGEMVFLPAQGWGAVVDIAPSGVALVQTVPAGYYTWDNGATTSLPPLAGSTSTVMYAVNSAGTAVGLSQRADLAIHLTVWQNGIPEDLGTPAGSSTSLGFGINDAGVIVGTSDGISGGAFIYRNGAFEMLNSLMGASTGWWFSTAEAINGRGDIVGSGTPPGSSVSHGFLLVPHKSVDELITALMAALAASGLPPSDMQALQSLLQAFTHNAGANRQGLCNALDRFVTRAPRLDLPAGMISGLTALANELQEELHCRAR